MLAVLVVTNQGGHPAAYDVLVGLHVLCAVVGFGAVAISGAYGAVGRRAGQAGTRPESVGEVRRYFAAPSYMEYLLLLAPAFGVAAMAVRPGGREFGQLWAVAGIVIWILASTLLLGVVRPAEQHIRQADGDPERFRPGARVLTWAAAGSDLLFVVALVLMVTQPR